MGVSISVYGNPNGDKVSYPISSFYSGDMITAARWNELLSNVNSERARRGYGGIWVGFYDPISAPQLNALRDGINSAGYTGGFGGVNPGDVIYASHLNAMIYKIQLAGSVCFCDCNYCTCNCNYCTCDCNYACTCNCNYSDYRLKKDIKFLYRKKGLKIYQWSYKDSETIYEGVIAQDLLKTKYSKALRKDKNGFFMVNYNLLPINLKVIK